MEQLLIERIQQQIEDELAKPFKPDSGDELKERLGNITSLLGTSAQCITYSSKLLRKAKGEWLRTYSERVKDLPPSVVKEYLNTAAIDLETLAVRCDRNDAALKHTKDSLISLLSILKTEIQLMNV